MLGFYQAFGQQRRGLQVLPLPTHRLQLLHGLQPGQAGPVKDAREEKSPSTLKRNSWRKNLFLEKKAKENQAEYQPAGSPAKSSEVAFKCDQCEALFESKDTLDNRIDETHSEKLTCK